MGLLFPQQGTLHYHFFARGSQIQGCPKVADALKKTNEKSVLRYQISNKFRRSLKRFVEYILPTVVSISSLLGVLRDRILHQGFIL